VHDGSGRIVVQGLTKQFGQVTAVQNLSFTVEPGSVTGFLGPNGAGKTTTLRMLLGLVTPTAGTATINGRPFNQLGTPASVVGAVLEAQGFHPNRSARNHLRVYASAIGVPDERVEQVLQLVGLSDAAHRKAGGYSMGMKQRLALATALLGDPQVLVLDEPANGLDPEGIAWLRSFLQSFARSGRTVLVSSHLLAEIEQTVDQVVIVSRGQTMYYGQLDDLRKQQQTRVIVRPADPHALVNALREAGITAVEPTPDGQLAVSGSDSRQIADIALGAGVAVYGMQEEQADLEQLFFQLTSGQFTAAQHNPYAQGPVQGWGPPGGAPQQDQQQYQPPQYPPPEYQPQAVQAPGSPQGGQGHQQSTHQPTEGQPSGQSAQAGEQSGQDRFGGNA
jgi:ABC-2 type transport system ATP-binding protein